MEMLLIAVFILLVIQGCVIYACRHDFAEALMSSLMLWLLGAPLILLLSCWGMSLTSGLMPDYSTGTREGYLTKISEKGVIWKTHEGEMQIGTGDLAALQKPFAFSVNKNNSDVYKLVYENQGKKVKLSYKGWLIMPYSIGDSNCEVVDVHLIK
jgi:hypothetical protein